ncbi:hypothetical protein HAPS_0314 [Glaesserella parasuis SH0165]|uniref:Uncharacterized protein n=1 Tax=Glaesserella parasuis serovar 5 (strain SH0165) TaxID=557723 RepID=B8F3U6_GLAP5|nr:hypothetical protein HAPS_0314 [Glaesserella parasuis SH0165]
MRLFNIFFLVGWAFMPDVYVIGFMLILWIVIIVGHKCPTYFRNT